MRARGRICLLAVLAAGCGEPPVDPEALLREGAWDRLKSWSDRLDLADRHYWLGRAAARRYWISRGLPPRKRVEGTWTDAPWGSIAPSQLADLTSAVADLGNVQDRKLALGISLTLTRRFESAAEALRSIPSDRPESWEAKTWLAIVRYHQDRFDEAHRLADSDPILGPRIRAWAAHHDRRLSKEPAVDDPVLLARIDPSRAPALEGPAAMAILGDSLAAQETPERLLEAARAYRIAGDTPSLSAAARALLRRHEIQSRFGVADPKDLSDARALLQESLLEEESVVELARLDGWKDLEPRGPIGLRSRGTPADLELAIRIEPENPWNWHRRALKGESESAMRDWDRALQLDPGFSEALRARGLAKVRAGGDGWPDLDRAASVDPGSATWMARAEARLAMGDPAGALRESNRAVESDPASPAALRLRSRCRGEDRLGAIDDLARASELHPKDPSIHAERAALRLKQSDRVTGEDRRKQLTQGVEDATRVLEIRPDDPEALALRGEAHLRLSLELSDDPTAALKIAIANFTRSIDLKENPDLLRKRAEAWRRLARAMRLKGLDASAEERAAAEDERRASGPPR